MKAITRDERVRVKCITPTKGSVGDMTDESMANSTSIPSILARYGGNLAEIARWRGSQNYGVQPTADLEEALEQVKEATNLANSKGYADIKTALEAEMKGENETIDNKVVDSAVGGNSTAVENGDVSSTKETESEGVK